MSRAKPAMASLWQCSDCARFLTDQCVKRKQSVAWAPACLYFEGKNAQSAVKGAPSAPRRRKTGSKKGMQG